MRYTPKTKKVLLAIGVVCVCVLVGYLFFAHTSRGRILGLYAVAGWHAPFSVRSACIQDTEQRVTQKFSQPLSMDASARTALKEYWHYSYMRECLLKKGYAFMGAPIPASSASLNNTTFLYKNLVAGIVVETASSLSITKDNVLNVDFDYRLLKSDIVVGTTTLTLDTYVVREDIKTFEDLSAQVGLLVPQGSVVLAQSTGTTSRGVPYVRVQESGGRFGIALITPQARVLYIVAESTGAQTLYLFVEGLSYTADAVSVY